MLCCQLAALIGLCRARNWHTGIQRPHQATVFSGCPWVDDDCIDYSRYIDHLFRIQFRQATRHFKGMASPRGAIHLHSQKKSFFGQKTKEARIFLLDTITQACRVTLLPCLQGRTAAPTRGSFLALCPFSKWGKGGAIWSQHCNLHMLALNTISYM